MIAKGKLPLVRPEENKKKKMSMISITFAPSLPYSGAGMHLRLEENLKKNEHEHEFSSLPAYSSTEEGDFLEGGGDKFSGIEHCHSFRDIDLKFCRHVLLV